MTPLRQRFIEDMQLRNRSPKTIKTYVYHVAAFARFFNESPDQLGPDHAHRYLVHLRNTKKVSYSSYNQAAGALRFFYRVTCPCDEVVSRLPYGKRPKRLPVVLSVDEVARLLACVRSPVIRMLLRTIYAAGLRLGEALALTAEQFDAQRMVLRVFGKGQKERLLPLSPVLLEELREYWRIVKPGRWLFPTKNKLKAINHSTVQRACRMAAQEAGLAGKITPHTLRHCYATHLLEAGIDTRTIQALLGHHRVGTTAIYTHVTMAGLQKVISPLDRLPAPADKNNG